MVATAILKDLAEKRAYLAERLREEPLPTRVEAAAAVRKEIESLGLEHHVLALETDGYTVLLPKELDSADLLGRLNTAADRVAERRKGQSTDLAATFGTVLFHTVPEAPVFQEVLLQPKPTALLTYLLGYHAKLNQSTVIDKPKGTPALAFHADTGGKFPLPWPETAQVANVTWMLSDYTREGGCLCVVPGSHRLGNPPTNVPIEVDHPSVVAVEAPAGSVVVWHGGLWHGAFSREIEGIRRTLVLFFSRAHLEAQEPYKITTTREMLERNPARFGVMMGVADMIPWGPAGPAGGDPSAVSGLERFE